DHEDFAFSDNRSCLIHGLFPEPIFSHGYRKSTSDHGAVRLLPANIKISPNHTRAVIHDVQTHAHVRPKWALNANPVIPYYQGSFPLTRKKTDQDVMRLTVFDRVVHCLLSNMIKMRSYGGIMDEDCCLTLKAAIDAE